jgi:hypothetical protein
VLYVGDVYQNGYHHHHHHSQTNGDARVNGWLSNKPTANGVHSSSHVTGTDQLERDVDQPEGQGNDDENDIDSASTMSGSELEFCDTSEALDVVRYY